MITRLVTANGTGRICTPVVTRHVCSHVQAL